MSYRITVSDIKPVANKGSLKAFATVSIDDAIKLVGFRVVQQEGQEAWVSVPQQEYTNKEGQRRYSQTVFLTPELKEQVSAAVLEAWENQ